MKILVTGALGFIGSHFIKYILENTEDVEIVGLDNDLSKRQLCRIAEYFDNPNFEFLSFDIVNNDFSDVLDGIDIVVHFAAKTFVDHSVKYPESHFKNNIIGTFNLLNAVRLTKLGLFVQISTDEVYGDTKNHQFEIDSPLKPTNPYAASKAAAEMLVMGMGKTYNIPYLITRCENNYGPYQHPQKVLPVFIKSAMEGKYLPVYAPGTQRRCWFHVEDHCSALWFLIKRRIQGIVNIGTNRELTNLKLAKKVLQVLGKNYFRIKMIDTDKIRPYHDARYLMDCSYLHNLGWRPKYDLEDGLEETIKWYESNSDWLMGRGVND